MASTISCIPTTSVDDEALNTYLRQYRAAHELHKYTGQNVKDMLALLAEAQQNPSPDLLKTWQGKVESHNYRNREIKELLAGFLNDLAKVPKPQPRKSPAEDVQGVDDSVGDDRDEGSETLSVSGSASSDRTIRADTTPKAHVVPAKIREADSPTKRRSFAETRTPLSRQQAAFEALGLGPLFKSYSHTNTLLHYHGFDKSGMTFQLAHYFEAIFQDAQKNPMMPGATTSNFRRIPFAGQVMGMIDMTVNEEGLYTVPKFIQEELALPEVQDCLKALIVGWRKRALLKGSILPRWAFFGHDDSRFAKSDKNMRASFFTSAIRMRMRLYAIHAAWRNVYGRIVEKYASFPIHYRRRKDVDFDYQLCNIAHLAMKSMVTECEKILVTMDDGIISEPRYDTRAIHQAAQMTPHRLMRKTERTFEDREINWIDLLFKLCQLSIGYQPDALSWKVEGSLYQTVKPFRTLDEILFAVRGWADEHNFEFTGIGHNVKSFWRLGNALQKELKKHDLSGFEARQLAGAGDEDLFEETEVVEEKKHAKQDKIIETIRTQLSDDGADASEGAAVEFCESAITQLSIETQSDHDSDTETED